MDDERTAAELQKLVELCQLYGTDPEPIFADPSCELLEFGRYLNAILAVREVLRPRIEQLGIGK
jgi:hypothetical protein